MMVISFYSLFAGPQGFQHMLGLIGFVFLLATSGFLFLKFVDTSNSSWLKKIFSIPARKSTTNAIQLGGLPLAISIMTGLAFCLLSPVLSTLFSRSDQLLVKYWLVSSALIVIYGHLDDKYELRPIVKLVMQVLSVCSFALLSSQVTFPNWSALAFIVLSFWGMGVLNGSNLLDGLDTLTIKIGSVTFATYLFLGYRYHLPQVMIVAAVGLSTLMAFYYFNKEPAQIHLGEIGGSFLGFTSLLASCLLFKSIPVPQAVYHDRVLNAFCLSILPLSMPMVELAISFSRRIYNRKSPFSGDKYHLHHILRNYYHLSPSHASSVFALGYLACMGLGVLLLTGLSSHQAPLFAFIATNASLMAGYFIIGYRHWQGRNTINLTPAALFDYLRKKQVAVISSQECDEFKLEIISSGELHTDFDLIDEKSRDDEEDLAA